MPTPDIARASRLIAAPAADIFELLAIPAQHHLIDGSGSVQGAQPRTPTRLRPGATFGMNMKIVAPYKISNTVVEFEEGRRIAWRHFGGHVHAGPRNLRSIERTLDRLEQWAVGNQPAS